MMNELIIPCCRIEVEATASLQGFAWDPKHHGEPTEENVRKWMDSMNKSFAPGGVNERTSEGLDEPLRITKVRVVEQKTGHVVAEVGDE